MPYMVNCSHQGEGWCLACVQKLAEENIRLSEIVENLVSRPMTYIPYDNEADKIECPICEARSKQANVKVKNTEPIPDGYEEAGWSFFDKTRSLFYDIKHESWCPHAK